jgi:hypothetical protein
MQTSGGANQIALTIVAPIKPQQKDALKQLLADLGSDPANNRLIPFGRLGQVHFARLLVLDETTDLRGAPIPPHLVFLSDVDAPLRGYLDHLVDLASAGLDQIFGHCEGYPAPNGITRAQRLAYLRAHAVKANAAYVNTIGRTVQQVLHEAQLREAIQQFLDRSAPEHPKWDALQVRAEVRKFVAREDNLRWARRPAARPPLAFRVREKLHLIAVPLAGLAVLPALLLGLPVGAVLLRIHERTDPAPHLKPDPAHVLALAALEDRLVQNQFSAVGFLKPGWFRFLTASTALFLADYVARHIYNRGELTGIKTIHFARWVMLDGGRRLIFASNYDGSLESYMDDFIDKVAWGLNALFSNGVGYPRTNWLVQDGARDELAFKNFLRRHQVLTPFWYSAYGHLTARNVENNAKIRAGLYGRMSVAEAEEWVRRL